MSLEQRSDGKYVVHDPPLYDGVKQFYRRLTEEPVELEIVSRLLESPHHNVIKIYGVGENYFDMEILDKNKDPNEEVVGHCVNGLRHLHSLHIVYVDIRSSNMGWDAKERKWKIHNFGKSGVLANNDIDWMYQPKPSPKLLRGTTFVKKNFFDIDNYLMNEFRKEMIELIGKVIEDLSKFIAYESNKLAQKPKSTRTKTREELDKEKAEMLQPQVRNIPPPKFSSPRVKVEIPEPDDD